MRKVHTGPSLCISTGGIPVWWLSIQSGKMSWNVLSGHFQQLKATFHILGHSASLVYPFWSLVVLIVVFILSPHACCLHKGKSFKCLIAVGNLIQKSELSNVTYSAPPSHLLLRVRALWPQGTVKQQALQGLGRNTCLAEKECVVNELNFVSTSPFLSSPPFLHSHLFLCVYVIAGISRLPAFRSQKPGITSWVCCFISVRP